jgi:hypothetical protein
MEMIGLPTEEEKQYRMVENFYHAYCAYCKDRKPQCRIMACEQFKKAHA